MFCILNAMSFSNASTKRKINSFHVRISLQSIKGIYYATNANVKLANVESAFSAYIFKI